MLNFDSAGALGGIATSSCLSHWRYESLEDFILKKKEMRKAARRKFLGISLG